MKKTLLSLSLLTIGLSATAQTQIGNGNFEQWESSTNENKEPVNWNSFKSASGNSTLITFYGSSTMGRSNQLRPGGTGSYAGKIWSKSVLGVTANGNMTLGRINMGSSTATDASNYNATVTNDPVFSETFTDTPDSLVVWVKFYSSNAATNARVSTVIHSNVNFKDPNDVGGANTVATAILNFTSNGAVWQRLSIPFSYVTTPPTSAYIISTFTTSAIPGGGTANDSLIVDDIELVYLPKASFTANNQVCAGTALNFTNTSTHYPTSYSWNFGDGSPTDNSANPSHTYASAGTYQVTLTATNQWGSSTTTAYTVNVTALDDASFIYPSSTICLSSVNQTPTINSPGTFSSSPAGLTFVSTTSGEIDVNASAAGTYTITYTTSGTCPNTETEQVTLTTSPDATFSYANAAYCTGDTDPSPVFGNGASGGEFTSSTGLVIGNTSGIIDLSGSTAGTYTVTNTIPASGSCPAASNTTSITINQTPTVGLGAFSSVCSYSPAFVLTGGTPSGGTYSGAGVSAGSFDPSLAPVNTTTTITYTYNDGTCTGTGVNTVYVSDCLGLEEMEQAVVTIYPNPTTGKLTLGNVLESTSVLVYDISGSLVNEYSVSPTSNEISIESLISGTYFFAVQNQVIRVVKK